MAETSTKPYLIRAIHEWCTDNGFTPYLAVSVDERTVVPREHVRNGEIVLNVSMLATHRLALGNELIEFQARFGGVPRELSIPVENVSAIYARENGQGMAFEVARPSESGEAGESLESEPLTELSSAAQQKRSRAPRRGGDAGRGNERGPRLVPISAEEPSSSVSQPTRSPDDDGNRGPSLADDQAEARRERATRVETARDAADHSKRGPDDNGDDGGPHPSPGRPRLTRIK